MEKQPKKEWLKILSMIVVLVAIIVGIVILNNSNKETTETNDTIYSESEVEATEEVIEEDNSGNEEVVEE